VAENTQEPPEPKRGEELDEVDRFFGLSEAGTGIGTEFRAGLTTYLTMAYIIFVNPAILSQAGMDFGSVLVATCLAAAAGSALMGLLANYPIAQAPGMGLNAFFALTAVPLLGGSWETALACVFISGVLFFVLSLTPFREWLINAIPRELKLGIAAGIGFFLAIIGLKGAGIIEADPDTLLKLADLSAPGTVFACVGFLLMVALYARGFPGAILIGIFFITVAAIATGEQPLTRLAAEPPEIAPTFLKLDFAGVLTPAALSVIFTFLLLDVLDTAGTLIGVGERANLLDKKGRLPRLRRALLADSGATVIGAALGTSTTTSYIESTTGIQEGGRTGLTSVFVAVFFVLSIGLAPLAHTVPEYATAPALIFVACMMIACLKSVSWEDVTEYVPVVVIAITMPLTFSIATGIGLGFITHTGLKILTRRFAEINGAVALIAALFLVMLALE